MTYWLDLFTGVTWNEFRNAGSKVTGFRETRLKTIQKIKEGDKFLCYLTGVSRFVGLLEVKGEAYTCETPIWGDEIFPCRLPVSPIVQLDPEYGIPVRDLRDELSCFKKSASPNAWTGAFRGSPSKWSKSDGEAVVAALRRAELNPKKLPTDQKKLAKKLRTYTSRDQKSVKIHDEEETITQVTNTSFGTSTSEHTEIQALLLKLGADMGFNVWVARNDRSRMSGGKMLCDFSKIITSLPLQFDDATNKTIELIDVLWLKGNSIIAAFEVESTTSIYSGLLRMSDLTAMQPNLNIPIYLVAPDDRRNKVITEINRPTFRKLCPPLSDICRLITFSELKNKISEIGPYLQFIKPEFLEELSEECFLTED